MILALAANPETGSNCIAILCLNAENLAALQKGENLHICQESCGLEIAPDLCVELRYVKTDDEAETTLRQEGILGEDDEIVKADDPGPAKANSSPLADRFRRLVDERPSMRQRKELGQFALEGKKFSKVENFAGEELSVIANKKAGTVELLFPGGACGGGMNIQETEALLVRLRAALETVKKARRSP